MTTSPPPAFFSCMATHVPEVPCESCGYDQRALAVGGMAEIIRECCRQVRPDLVGPLAETPDGAEFTVTSATSGRKYRVIVTEEGLRP